MVGKESGGNFFISDYGLRVVNATNSCVEWNISLNHGTGILENGLEQIIITMLLSRTTERSWEKYEARYKKGLLQPHELLWPETSTHDVVSEEEEDLV